jgi:hypothetical protein
MTIPTRNLSALPALALSSRARPELRSRFRRPTVRTRIAAELAAPHTSWPQRAGTIPLAIAATRRIAM